jgi:DNA-binding response OmpR family regulator
LVGTILVVDDDPTAVRLMKLSLESEGFEVRTAATALEALRTVQSKRPDMILLDIMMPDVDGLQVIRHLRSMPGVADVPVILVTAKAQVDDRIMGLRAGADDYIVKPADPREVVARVQAVLGRAKRATAGRQPRVLAVMGARGGVGTTTVAVNLAAALTAPETPVILIDLHPYAGTVAWQLKLKGASLADLIALPPDGIGPTRIESTLVSLPTGLKVLLSPPAGANLAELPAAPIASLVRGASSLADYVVLDLPHVLTPASRLALELSDMALLVLAPDGASVACAEEVLPVLQSCGLRGDAVGLVIVNRTQTMIAVPVAEIERRLQRTSLGVLPPAQDELTVAERRGSPLALAAPPTTASMAVREMAERVRTAALAGSARAR